MILIADSGSTKCDWVLTEKGKNEQHFTTIGFNPIFIKEAQIAEHIRANELFNFADSVKEIFFYGASCSSDEKQKIITTGLQSVFRKAKITVKHDLDGAAFATCQGKPGIACILGTGSNGCYFDGNTVSQLRPALGFILGDEGSGAYFGKILLRKYLYHQLSDNLCQAFNNQFTFDKEQIIDRVYSGERPNTFLAGFMSFLGEHKKEKFVSEMIANGLKDFMQTHVCCYLNYRELPVHFVGSIAFYFEDILRHVAKDLDVHVGMITKRPVEGLVKYHLSLVD